MNERQLAQLIRYVIYRVGDLGGFATTIRVVKFLYLIDLEHQRRYGRILTGLAWLFYHHGPYAFELGRLSATCGIDLEVEEFVNRRGYRGNLLSMRYPEAPPEHLRLGTVALVDDILSIWCDQDTTDLLQYVYRTEPMLAAQRGAPLDWSVVARGTRLYSILLPKLPEAEAQRIRESIQSYSESTSEDEEGMECPATSGTAESLAAVLDALDEGDPAPFPYDGPIGFDASDLPLPESPDED